MPEQIRPVDRHFRGNGQEVQPSDDGDGGSDSGGERAQDQGGTEAAAHGQDEQDGHHGVFQGDVPFHAEQQQVRSDSLAEEIRQVPKPPGVEDQVDDSLVNQKPN